MKLWIRALLLTLLPGLLQAQPDLSKAVGETLADRGSAYYSFERLRLDSADGQRHYRIDLAIPRGAAPKAGYPALWMLDGNAALAELREDWLAELHQSQTPPLLVMVGYDTDLRFDVTARTFDYTPAPAGREGALIEDSVRQRAAGGAAAFRQLLQGELRQRVATRYPLDAAKQALWGHSYGGLFVLDTLFAAGSFRDYIAASPALWWQGGLILDSERDYLARSQHAPAQVLLVRGGAERPSGSNVDSRLLAERRKALAAVPADAAEQLVTRLDGLPEVTAQYREYADAGHGALLPLSLHLALRRAAGLE